MIYILLYIVGYFVAYYTTKWVVIDRGDKWDWSIIGYSLMGSIWSWAWFVIVLIIWAYFKFDIPERFKGEPPKWL